MHHRSYDLSANRQADHRSCSFGEVGCNCNFQGRPFDTLKLLSCIVPARRKGLQRKYRISSAIKVGLLPEGFKLVDNYDWEQNIVQWRGPWVKNVLKQDCVVGAAIRERDAIDARAKRDKTIQQALQGFGMATAQVPDDIRVQNLVDSSAFDVFVQASFRDRSFVVFKNVSFTRHQI